MIDAIFNVARNSIGWSFSWDSSRSYVAHLLSEQTTPSLDRATILLSPYLHLHRWDKQMVIGWTAVVSRVSYSEEVGSSVVDTLLQLGSEVTLRPHIPIGIWAWLKEEPSLPPWCVGRDLSNQTPLCYLRGLGDLDILKSYLVAVWSEWDHLFSHFSEMQNSIVEDFGGVGMHHYRADLIKRSDHILGQLNRKLEYFKQFNPSTNAGDVEYRKMQYGRLMEVLLEVDKNATRVLAGMSRELIGFIRSTNSCGHIQNRIRPSAVLCLSRVHDSVTWSRWCFFREVLGLSSHAFPFP